MSLEEEEIQFLAPTSAVVMQNPKVQELQEFSDLQRMSESQTLYYWKGCGGAAIGFSLVLSACSLHYWKGCLSAVIGLS